MQSRFNRTSALQIQSTRDIQIQVEVQLKRAIQIPWTVLAPAV